jgi:hypothetical protein
MSSIRLNSLPSEEDQLNLVATEMYPVTLLQPML